MGKLSNPEMNSDARLSVKIEQLVAEMRAKIAQAGQAIGTAVNKHKKKALAFGLAGVTALTMTACDPKTQQPAATPGPTTSVTEQTPRPTESERPSVTESPDLVVIEEPVETPAETTQPEASGEWDPLAGREVPEGFQVHVNMLIEEVEKLCAANECSEEAMHRHLSVALDRFFVPDRRLSNMRSGIDQSVSKVKQDHHWGR